MILAHLHLFGTRSHLLETLVYSGWILMRSDHLLSHRSEFNIRVVALSSAACLLSQHSFAHILELLISEVLLFSWDPFLGDILFGLLDLPAHLLQVQ